MKRTLTLLLSCLFMLTLMTACGGGDDIVGTWQLHSVSGEELTESEKSATIEFKSDGTMVQTRGDKTREGTWEIKEEDGKKVLSITADDRTTDSPIKSLDGSTLSFEERGEVVTLKRK